MPASLLQHAKPIKVVCGRPFGAIIEADAGLKSEDLCTQDLGAELRQLWHSRGVVVVRGLSDMTPEVLAEITKCLGPLEPELATGRDHAMFSNVPVMRIGNVKGEDGEAISMPSGMHMTGEVPDIQYKPEQAWPSWHSDAIFRQVPPAGSLLYCKQAPASGGETGFADMVAAWQALDKEEQDYFKGLDCIVSLSHHDTKIHTKRSDYPFPTDELRAANPPNRVPMVLQHPVTGHYSLYGLNAGTCYILQREEEIDSNKLDELQKSPSEDPSVSIWRKLLPRFTSPDFAVAWKWQEGDLVAWDNRSTLHCPTGFDHEKYVREMWRTTILPENTQQSPAN
mmetsp:Transcript_55272/g.131803  ORF Transcript_55272/g.131803 Transcript_55272/m.131803 type:complete len:338 (-) Transcript_55272:137-1150(-)